jgi:rhodanese-related sulfurtransferase
MLTYTILNLLGYPCCSLDFGMMDWNLNALVKDPWDNKADYEVETTTRNMTEEYAFPDLASDASDATGMIKDAANKYFEREGSPIIRSADVKAVVDRWSDGSSRYQIVDVRSRRDYENGHIANAVNIPLKEIAKRGNLSKMDPAKTIIVCSENGQMGQLACTVLNLLGYRSVNLLFGMMDWNSTCVRGADQWDGVASYTVELGD